MSRAATPVVVDVTQLLVLANPEVVAMGGAGAAFASSAPGLVSSPAAPANRRQEARALLTGSLLFLQARIGTPRKELDLGNLGEPLASGVRMFDASLAGGYRGGAAGVLAAGAVYNVEDVWVGVSEGHASIAAALLDGRIAVGAGPRLLGLRLTEDGEHRDYLGAGVEAGAVISDWHQDWNFALTLRSGVEAGPTRGTWPGIAAAHLAPQVIAGVGWGNLDRLRDHRVGLPVRLVADVVVDAPVPDAAALETTLQGDHVPRGTRYTVSPRVGAEVDLWRNRFRLRGGSYLEPSRTSLAGPRPHATGGFELRLFRIKAFQERIKLDLAWQIGVDYAPRYFRGAWFGINVWQQGETGGHIPARRVEESGTAAEAESG